MPARKNPGPSRPGNEPPAGAGAVLGGSAMKKQTGRPDKWPTALAAAARAPIPFVITVDEIASVPTRPAGVALSRLRGTASVVRRHRGDSACQPRQDPG